MARAQGLAATRTAMARQKVSVKGSPVSAPTASSTATSTRTPGTKNFVNRSVNRWVAEVRSSASRTILTTLARVFSLARRVTAMSRAPEPLTVPA